MYDNGEHMYNSYDLEGLKKEVDRFLYEDVELLHEGEEKNNAYELSIYFNFTPATWGLLISTFKCLEEHKPIILGTLEPPT